MAKRKIRKIIFSSPGRKGWYWEGTVFALIIFNLFFLFKKVNDCEWTRRKLFFSSVPLLKEKLGQCFLREGKYQLVERYFPQENFFLLKQKDPQLRKKEILFWKKQLGETPNFSDGWLALAILWKEENDIQKAKLAAQKACRLSPDRQEIRRAVQSLGFVCP